MPEVACAIDVLDVDDFLRNALFKHSRLDLGIQALEDQRLICFQVGQVANGSRKEIESYVNHRGGDDERKKHDRNEHAQAAGSACAERDYLAVTREAAQSYKRSDQQ